MDLASVACARALPVRPGDAVLDMCAAPGGKTLVLAQQLGPRGALVANESSSRRRARLRAVVDSYLPAAQAARVHVTGYPGTVFGRARPGMFDAVLVDAPCTGDRHLLAQARELASWTPARPKAASDRQLKLLQSAVHAVRPGGHVLYATCSVWPQENDDVIAQLLSRSAKKGWRVDPVPLAAPLGEATVHGWHILPDVCGGLGPMYFSLLTRRTGS